MINIEQLSSGALSAGEPGDLFLPRAADEAAFLVGLINNYPVAVDLETFTASDLAEVGARRGLLAKKCPIFVDQDTRVPSRGAEINDVPVGSLVLAESNVAILATTKNKTAHYVTLIGDQIADDSRFATAFTGWAFCAQDNFGQWSALYEHGKSAAEWIKSIG